MAFTLFYLSAIVLIPLAALIIRPWELGFDGFWKEIAAPRVLAALKLSFGASAIAALVNSVFGLIVAWVLVRYRFPGKRLIDALVDLPFALPTAVVVRTLQPVLADLHRDSEEASATLGATRFQTFRRVILPMLAPTLLTGTAMAFARAVGEYGSVIFIAGNLPMVSEITPLLIIIKLQEYDYAGAAAIGVIMLAVSFIFLLALNALQAWVSSRR